MYICTKKKLKKKSYTNLYFLFMSRRGGSARWLCRGTHPTTDGAGGPRQSIPGGTRAWAPTSPRARHRAPATARPPT